MKISAIKYKKWLRSKYFWATMVFIWVLLFSERNNIFNQFEYKERYLRAREENIYYRKEIERLKNEYNELFTNDKNLEKFAREKYLMKRDDEDVYVIVK